MWLGWTGAKCCQRLWKRTLVDPSYWGSQGPVAANWHDRLQLHRFKGKECSKKMVLIEQKCKLVLHSLCVLTNFHSLDDELHLKSCCAFASPCQEVGLATTGRPNAIQLLFRTDQDFQKKKPVIQVVWFLIIHMKCTKVNYRCISILAIQWPLIYHKSYVLKITRNRWNLQSRLVFLYNCRSLTLVLS